MQFTEIPETTIKKTLNEERNGRHVKNGRQKQILAIITEHEVETQEELITRLRMGGFNATQATVSRDIKDLKLIKIATDNGHYKYVQSIGEDGRSSVKFDNVLRETVVSARSASTLVVVKTYNGMAMAAATAIDAMQLNCILGTIAGDDTIFIAVTDSVAGELIVQKIESTLKNR